MKKGRRLKARLHVTYIKDATLYMQLLDMVSQMLHMSDESEDPSGSSQETCCLTRKESSSNITNI